MFYNSTAQCSGFQRAVVLWSPKAKNHSKRVILNMNKLQELAQKIENCDLLLIGAGAGLSASAGHLYSGKRFDENFADFKQKYGIKDIYSGGFYPYPTLEEFWAWWSRHIFINRYAMKSDERKKQVYQDLLQLTKNKDYFVLTTNVDHLFQDNAFDKQKLFYTQGDYGLFQCSRACHKSNYDNEEIVREMCEKQENMRIPSELIPYCPRCEAPMTPNLRKDNLFIEDEGWHKALERYKLFLEKANSKQVLLLELGVGQNTPVIIKYPFWEICAQNPKAFYCAINSEASHCPSPIKARSLIIQEDIGIALAEVKQEMK